MSYYPFSSYGFSGYYTEPKSDGAIIKDFDGARCIKEVISGREEREQTGIINIRLNELVDVFSKQFYVYTQTVARIDYDDCMFSINQMLDIAVLYPDTGLEIKQNSQDFTNSVKDRKKFIEDCVSRVKVLLLI